MKKTANKIISVLLSAVMLFTLLPAFAAAGPREITEVFSAQLFSNAAVNEILKAFPRFAGSFEDAWSEFTADPVSIQMDVNNFIVSGDLYTYVNGENGTSAFAEFLNADNINVYPQTLGAYLAENGYGDIAAALLAAEGWADFDPGDGYAFDFDWGLDAIDGLAEKYAAFTGVIALLIDAAKPLFTAALGTQDTNLSFGGETQLICLEVPEMQVTAHLGLTLNWNLNGVLFNDITGNVLVPAMNMYQHILLPLYRALGVSTAIGYTFADWDQNADAAALAALLFDPLYALVSAVQNDPDARETLISFYGAESEALIAQIGSGLTQAQIMLTLNSANVEYTAPASMASYIHAFDNAITEDICNAYVLSFPFNAETFFDADARRAELSELLNALTASATEVIASGVCGLDGDNLVWTLTSDGVLTVSGAGRMCNTGFPRQDLKQNIVSAVLEEGVESVGARFFENCSALTSVSLPESLLAINMRAFRYCSSLSGIALPEAVHYLGEDAFVGCSSLTQITVPWVTSVTSGAFKNCTSLTAVTITSPYSTIGEETFSGCSALTDIYYSGDAEDWYLSGALRNYYSAEIHYAESYAHGSCGESVRWRLTEDGTLTLIGYGPMNEYAPGAFPWEAYRGMISSVTIADGITNLPVGALQNCPALTEVRIPASVAVIPANAFDNSTALATVSYGGGEALWEAAFNGVPEYLCNVQYFFSTYYAEGECGENIVWTLTEDGSFAFHGEGHMRNYTNPYSWAYSVPWERLKSRITSVTMDNGIYNLCEYAFFGCSNLTGVVLSNTLDRLHSSSLRCCPGLTQLELPDSITVISSLALSWDTGLTQLRLPKNLSILGHSSLYGCTGITKIEVPKGLCVVRHEAFHTFTNLTDVYYTGSEAQWNEIEFEYGSGDLLNANIYYSSYLEPDAPDMIESGPCGEYGGANVQWELYSNGLLRVVGEGNMGTHVPLYDYRAKTLVIDEGVTGICNDGFAWCYGLTEAYIPQSVVSIGEEVFGNCYDLEIIYYTGNEAEWDAIAFAEDWFSYSERMAAVVFADGTHRCGACDEETQNYVDGRCEVPGSYEYVYFCPICGEETKRVTHEVEAEPHAWGAWTILTYPTDTDEGLMERRCLWDDTHVETAQIPAGEFGAHELLRGYCGGEGDGKNLIWSLSDDDVITISGTGTMRNYGKYVDFGDAHDYDWSSGNTYPRTLGPSVPWPPFGDYEAYLLASLNISTGEDEIRAILNGTLRFSDILNVYYNEYNSHPYTVVIEEGVTHVGANAFPNMNVTGLSLPSTLEWIGQSAFNGINVESLVLPEGVRWLDPYAFSGGRYESVTLPSTLEIAGNYSIGSYSDQYLLSDITVLSADEYLETVLSGINVKCVPGSLPQYDIDEYRTVLRFEDLASDYYFLSHVDESAAEDLEYLALELGTGLTEEQIENYYQFLLGSTLFDLWDCFGVEFGSVEEGLDYIVAEANAILGTSLAGDQIFIANTQGDPGSLSTGKLWLSPEADAAYTARFGAAFDDMFFKYDGSSLLKDLRYNNYDNRVPAQWITLHGHCGSALEAQYGSLLTFEAVEHDPANGEITLAPTCTDPGVRSITCPVCGETFTEEIPASGAHTFVIASATAPTCTEAGETVYLCAVCGYTYTETAVPLGHGTQGCDVSSAPSTCTVRGYSMTVCIACGEITDYEEYELDPTNHNWGEWVLVTPATYLSEGLEQRTCGWCGNTETRAIPTLEPEETISDPATGIELQLQEGVLPENTVFAVDEEFDGTYFRLLNREVGNVSSTLYNITPVADGEKVQPDGYVLVRLPIPAGYNPDTLSIYYISTETGTTERMDCYIEDGYICFQTTHFSVYAIVDRSAQTGTTVQTEPTEQPQNGPTGIGAFFARIANWFRTFADFFKNLFNR